MKSARVLKSIVVASVCACALVVAVGCSSAASSSASSASGNASSASVSASSASASSATSSSAASSAASSSAASAQLTPESAKAQGYQVFEGTVRVCNAEELIKLQAIDIDPAAAGGGGTYAVLVFDKETPVTGEQADGSGQTTRSSKMMGIAEHTDYSSFVVDYGNLDLCKSLDGQKVTICAKAKDIMFPSDVRLPIGEPSASEILILS